MPPIKKPLRERKGLFGVFRDDPCQKRINKEKGWRRPYKEKLKELFLGQPYCVHFLAYHPNFADLVVRLRSAGFDVDGRRVWLDLNEMQRLPGWAHAHYGKERTEGSYPYWKQFGKAEMAVIAAYVIVAYHVNGETVNKLPYAESQTIPAVRKGICWILTRLRPGIAPPTLHDTWGLMKNLGRANREAEQRLGSLTEAEARKATLKHLRALALKKE